MSIWANSESWPFFGDQISELFFISVVREYLNEISPTMNGPNKPKTSETPLRIDDLQIPASGQDYQTPCITNIIKARDPVGSKYYTFSYLYIIYSIKTIKSQSYKSHNFESSSLTILFIGTTVKTILKTPITLEIIIIKKIHEFVSVFYSQILTWSSSINFSSN